MAAAFSNQATPKYLGFVYQILVALEICFEAKKNQQVWIECFGDIYDGTTSIEVKHHLNDGYLSDNSIDFWKTLKNLVLEDTDDMGKFILHTTQEIPKTSIFYDWNAQKKTKKYNLIRDCNPTKTSQPFYDEIIAEKRRHIIEILDKFQIHSSKDKVDVFWLNLSQNRYLGRIEENYRADAVYWLHGYLNHKAVETPYKWCIDINDFDNDFLMYSKQFNTTKIPFPYFEESAVDTTESHHFEFINELEEIGIKETSRLTAISDYLRSHLSQNELLTKQPTLMEQAISQFEDRLLSKCRKLKDSHGDDLSIGDSDSDVSRRASRKAYHEFQNSDPLDIEHVNGTDPYFMAGKALGSVENKRFSWNYSKDDLK